MKVFPILNVAQVIGLMIAGLLSINSGRASTGICANCQMMARNQMSQLDTSLINIAHVVRGYDANPRLSPQMSNAPLLVGADEIPSAVDWLQNQVDPSFITPYYTTAQGPLMNVAAPWNFYSQPGTQIFKKMMTPFAAL